MSRKKEIEGLLLSSEAYIVEKILKKFMKGNLKGNADGIVHYEVKWVGYDETTIEPETNPDIKALVEKKELMEAHSGSKKTKNIEKQLEYEDLLNGVVYHGNPRR